MAKLIATAHYWFGNVPKIAPVSFVITVEVRQQLHTLRLFLHADCPEFMWAVVGANEVHLLMPATLYHNNMYIWIRTQQSLYLIQKFYWPVYCPDN